MKLVSLQAKTAYPPIFGNLPIKLATEKGGLGGGFTTEDLSEAEQNRLQIDIMSKTGILKEQILADRYINGIKNPDEYLEAKQRAMNAIGKELTEIYLNEYQRNLGNGTPREKVSEKAMEYVNQRKAHLMKLHNEQYPLELTKKVFGKIGWGKKRDDGKEDVVEKK